MHEAQTARMLEGMTISDLHVALGEMLASGEQTFFAGGESGHRYKASDHLFEDLTLDSMVRKIDGPGIPDTPFASTANADWIDTERLLNATWVRFRDTLHTGGQSKAQLDARRAAYRAECAQIIARGQP